jgi:hypothetical protein
MVFKKEIFVVLAVFLLTGCAEKRQRVADWLTPPTPAQMVVRLEVAVSKGKTEEAIQMGETYLAGNPQESTEKVHRLLSLLLIEQGDAVGALRHLQQADQSRGSVNVVSPEVERQQLTPEKPTSPEAQPPVPPSVSATAGDASASISAGKAQAQVGGASARVLP